MKNNLIPDGIIKLLRKDHLQNVNILNFVEDNPITGLFSKGSSILIKGISDKEWTYISSNNETEFALLLNILTGTNINFAVAEDWQLPIIKRKFDFEIELTTMKYYLPVEVNIPIPRTNKIFTLSAEHAEYIYNNSIYKDFLAVDYIKERILKGISGGMFEDDKPIAWAITHDDGAIGFLHVLEEFRNKGIAQDLTYYIIKKVREKNKIPFAHIEENNIKSINLAKKLGFKKFKQVHWLHTI